MTVPLPAPPLAGDSGINQHSPAVWGVTGFILRLFPALIPLALFISAGVIGIDFGTHWDEKDHIQSIHDSLQTGTFLPMGAHSYDVQPGLKGGYYGYPSVIFWVGIFSAAPEIARHWPTLGAPDLLNFINSPAFLLRVRTVCLVISSLGILWIYLLILVLRKNWWLALLAASLMACSWELGYHARWLATDTIVTQFAALCLLLCVMAMKSRRWTKRLLRLGAVAAGLAAGTKYPAGLLILPVLVTSFLAEGNHQNFRGRLLQLAEFFAILLGVFVLTTPGALLQPTHFLAWLQFDGNRYASRLNGPYTIVNQGEYLRLSLDYLSLVFFSRYAAISAVFSGIGILGLLASLKRDWKLIAIILIFPILYLAYFCTQGMLVIRNLLVMTPFLAALIVLGASYLFKYLPARWPRWSAAAILATCLTINAAWVIYAAQSIPKSKDPSYEVHQLADYLRGHPHTHFYVTPPVNALLLKYTGNTWPDTPLVAGSATRTVVALISSDLDLWPANRRDLVLRGFAPFEININYYPAWMRDHIALIDDPTGAGNMSDGARFLLRQQEVQEHAQPHEMLTAYLDCGVMNQTQAGNLKICKLNGSRWLGPRVGVGSPTFSSQLVNDTDLKFEITGLDAHQQYTVGIAWWDYSGDGRIQSVYVNSPGNAPRRVLGPLPLPQWIRHDGKPPEPAAELNFILPQDITAGGTAELSIHRDSPSSTTVISDLWLLQKPLESAGH